VVVPVFVLLLAASLLVAYHYGAFSKKKPKTKADECDINPQNVPMLGAAANSAIFDPTLLNTNIEISLPLFLELKYPEQYRTLELISEGGAGVVYAGELLDPVVKNRSSCTTVVVKVVKEGGHLTVEQNLNLFYGEIAVMWSLSFQPNIATLVGYCEKPRSIITRKYDVDLGKLISSPKVKFAPENLTTIARGIARAMQIIHKKEIVHRDLKPSNILINKEKDQFVPYVGDFGLAAYGKQSTIDGKEYFSVAGFSLRYAAPEVLAETYLGHKKRDIESEKKSDVYSYSIILYEMLTRLFAWDGLERADIEIKVRNSQRPQIPSNVANSEDPNYVKLLTVMKMSWEESPEARPTFEKIIEMIQH